MTYLLFSATLFCSVLSISVIASAGKSQDYRKQREDMFSRAEESDPIKTDPFGFSGDNFYESRHHSEESGRHHYQWDRSSGSDYDDHYKGRGSESGNSWTGGSSSGDQNFNGNGFHGGSNGGNTGPDGFGFGGRSEERAKESSGFSSESTSPDRDSSSQQHYRSDSRSTNDYINDLAGLRYQQQRAETRFYEADRKMWDFAQAAAREQGITLAADIVSGASTVVSGMTVDPASKTVLGVTGTVADVVSSMSSAKAEEFLKQYRNYEAMRQSAMDDQNYYDQKSNEMRVHAKHHTGDDIMDHQIFDRMHEMHRTP